MLDANGNELYEEIGTAEYIDLAYATFGKHVNSQRHIPMTIDGLKPVYRHVLQACYESPDKLNKVVAIVGDCLKKYHFTGDASVAPVVSALVNDGMLIGQGNHGVKLLRGEDAPPAACFAGDTKIILRDGRTLAIKDIVEEFDSGKELYVMSCDTDGGLHSGRITHAQLTGKKKVVKVTLDNGKEIICTPDHKFMKRDGTYDEVQNIDTSESLMPLYSRIDKEREYFDNKIGKYVLHHYVDFDDLDRCIDFNENDKINIHHIDRNHYNDNPNNLLVMNESSHLILHNKEDVKGWHKLSHEEKSESVTDTRHRMYLEDPEYWSKEYARISLSQSPESRTNSRKLFHKNWCVKMYRMLLDLGYKPDEITEDTWDTLKEELNLRRYRTDGSCNNGFNKSWKKISSKYFSTMNELKEYEKTFNHKIVSIEYLDELVDVYDITVDVYENFALEAGVFVHNCRYVEAKMNPIVRSQLDKISKYIPSSTTATGYEEWEYFPTPIPLSLVFNALGIGLGIGTRVPPFTIESLYDAYIHDDYHRLKINYGYELDQSCIETGLKNLWENGRGSLLIKIPYKFTKISGDCGYLISCDPQIFKPSGPGMKKLEEWESYGYLSIEDVSDTIPKLFIYRTNRTRAINEDQIEEQIKSACMSKKGYMCTVWDPKQQKAGMMGIRDWISISINNYTNLYERYRKDNLEKLHFDWIVWRDFPRASQLIVETKDDNKTPKYTYEEIVKIINDENLYRKGEKFRQEYKEFTVEHMNAVGRKSLNTLRTADASVKLKEIEDSIDEFNSLDINKEIKAYVDSYSIIHK